MHHIYICVCIGHSALRRSSIIVVETFESFIYNSPSPSSSSVKLGFLWNIPSVCLHFEFLGTAWRVPEVCCPSGKDLESDSKGPLALLFLPLYVRSLVSFLGFSFLSSFLRSCDIQSFCLITHAHGLSREALHVLHTIVLMCFLSFLHGLFESDLYVTSVAVEHCSFCEL